MKGKSKLYILCGIPFAGKTTLAKAMEKELEFTRVDLDDIKFELLGKGVRDDGIEQKQWDKVYKKMYERIENLLRQGKTVIHDTGNFTKNERNLVRKVANKAGVASKVIWVNTPEAVAKKRWLANKEKGSRFDISEESFHEGVGEMEPPDGESVLTYDSSIKAKDWIRKNRF